jgi:hypothetical protein
MDKQRNERLGRVAWRVRGRKEKWTYRRPSGLAVLVIAAAGALTACGGPGTPHVASLGGTGGHETTTTTGPTGNATQLLNEWADCMRSHGDPDQADPTIDANKDINVNWNPTTTGGIYGTNKGGQGNSGPGQYCRTYLNQAQNALGGGAADQPSFNEVTALKFSECMRANGIPDFPDPRSGGLVLSIGGDIDPSNSTFQHTADLCSHRTGMQVPGLNGTIPPGVVKLDGSSP